VAIHGSYVSERRVASVEIAKLAIERAGGEVDDDRVTELSATLDDSRPAGMPRVETTPAGEATDYRLHRGGGRLGNQWVDPGRSQVRHRRDPDDEPEYLE